MVENRYNRAAKATYKNLNFTIRYFYDHLNSVDIKEHGEVTALLLALKRAGVQETEIMENIKFLVKYPS